jgi:hypothetical protein
MHWRLGLRLLNTEERGTRTGARRGWAGPNGPAGLGPSGLSFGPIRSTVHLLRFGLFPLQLWALDVVISTIKTEGSLCMNFRSFHLGPQKFSIQAHWSLPPLEASWHVVGVP